MTFPVVGRDRDGTGRPRSARPRDGLGRPLPHGSTGVPRIPDDVVLPPGPALIEAQRLLDAGLPFHAHEILEGTWKAAPAGERDLWQGLAQLTVGLTHLMRGNPSGATALIRRGRNRLLPFCARPPHRVDVAGVIAWAEDLLRGCGTPADPPPLRLRVRSPGPPPPADRS